MRRFLVFLIIPILFGCEKYELESPPNLGGGKWIFTNYEITIISSIPQGVIIKNDTICVSSFGEQSFISGEILMRQNYESTQKDRRFIKGITTWEFDGPAQSNVYGLFCDYTQIPGTQKPDPFWTELSIYNKNLEILNTTNGSVTNYTYRVNDVGYPRTMELLSPPIVTDLYMSNGSRNNSVTVRVTLYFMR
jgi:hypothetical protein